MLFRANEGVSRPNGQENDPQFADVAGGAFRIRAIASLTETEIRTALGTPRVFGRLTSDRATLPLNKKWWLSQRRQVGGEKFLSAKNSAREAQPLHVGCSFRRSVKGQQGCR